MKHHEKIFIFCMMKEHKGLLATSNPLLNSVYGV